MWPQLPKLPLQGRKRSGKKICRFNEPKGFMESTTTNAESYQVYCRRNTREQIEKRGVALDSQRWIVPYNRHLLAMFDCHVNVKICSTIKAIKYLYIHTYTKVMTKFA